MNVEGWKGAAEPVMPPGGLTLDMLLGGAEIAEFLYGDRNVRRKVYHLAETSNLPVFRLGSRLCARRSVLLGWIIEQEGRNGH